MKLGILGQKYVKAWYKYEYECGASNLSVWAGAAEVAFYAADVG